MKRMLFFFAILTGSQLQAQQFFFSKENYKDSTLLAKAIPSLAEEVMAQYKNSDKADYFDDLFRYMMVAKQYNHAIAYIDSIRNSIPPSSLPGVNGVGVQYEVYIKAKMGQQSGNNSFNELFKKIFTSAYVNLDEDAKNYISRFGTPEIPPLKKHLDNLIVHQQNSDTINMKDAGELIRAYNSYIVYSNIVSLMKPIIAAEDNKEFSIGKVFIKTRDGSVVQAEAGRKKDIKSKLPTVFIFNIYIDSAFDVSEVKRYAAHGYACVVASTRGKGGSPQSIEPFEHDADDAYDIIDWISRQSWSNGKVGMTGGSYLGFAQWAAAKTLHPALKTIMPEVAVGIGVDYPMTGNVFMSYMLRWIHYVTNSKQTDDADFRNLSHWDSVFNAWYKRGASFRSLDTIEGRPNAIFQRWLQHPSFDSYWQNMTSYAKDFSKINIPVLTTTGYYDDDGNGAMYYYRQHYLNNPKANNYLIIGPYDHGGAQSYPKQELSGYKVDSIATTFNFIDLGIKWFDYVLKDSARPALLQDKVNYEVMGANEWKHATSLAAMSNDTLTFYLGNVRTNQHYKLDSVPHTNEYINQEIDFADRTDTMDEEDKNIIDSIINTKNAISFISRPVEKSFIVTGSFIASLNASINKRDMDVNIDMYELMPGGKYFELGTVLQRASYAKNSGSRQLLQPGKKETIPLGYSFMTCKQLHKGSRLVVVLGINKNSGWQINYGTGKDISDETINDAKQPLEIKWFADSYIKVPIWK
ncbi:MAG: CocE/NonD family hydrolase [Chitinophagales bacterium]